MHVAAACSEPSGPVRPCSTHTNNFIVQTSALRSPLELQLCCSSSRSSFCFLSSLTYFSPLQRACTTLAHSNLCQLQNLQNADRTSTNRNVQPSSLSYCSASSAQGRPIGLQSSEWFEQVNLPHRMPLTSLGRRMGEARHYQVRGRHEECRLRLDRRYRCNRCSRKSRSVVSASLRTNS